MINTPLQRYLRSRGACRQARKWAGRKGLRQAWATCKRTDWLLWLVEAEPLRVYEAAIAEPLRVYLAATAEPRRVYEAWRVYRAAKAEPQRVYEAAKAEASRVYLAATAEPLRVYHSGASPDEFRARVACPVIEGVS